MPKIQKVRWEPKQVSLHREKRMKEAQSNSSCKPFQFSLFQLLVDNKHSNSVELYQSLPDVFCGKQDKHRNADGSLPVLSRNWVFKGTPYELHISPANITVSDTKSKSKQKQGFYKTVLADYVELALHKMSIQDGFFFTDSDFDAKDFNLITTYYQIRKELKSVGKNYSFKQIKEAVNILAGLRYELSGEISKAYWIDGYFSPIDLVIKNDRKNPLHSELFITFNKFISKDILKLEWRSYNYYEYMKIPSSFWRVLFMRMSHRYTQASNQGYHFKLSTLIKEGALPNDLITTNIKKINRGLEENSHIIEKYETQLEYVINPETNRKTLNDYVVKTFPTKVFQNEQYRFNAHSQNIYNHRLTYDNRVVIKPMADQYKWKDYYLRYIQDKAEYDLAKKNWVNIS